MKSTACLEPAFIVQKATIDRTGVETMSSMSNGRRVSRNSLDTRNMAQFISLDPKSGINYDAAAEEVLAKVRADAAEQFYICPVMYCTFGSCEVSALQHLASWDNNGWSLHACICM